MLVVEVMDTGFCENISHKNNCLVHSFWEFKPFKKFLFAVSEFAPKINKYGTMCAVSEFAPVIQ